MKQLQIDKNEKKIQKGIPETSQEMPRMPQGGPRDPKEVPEGTQVRFKSQKPQFA